MTTPTRLHDAPVPAYAWELYNSQGTSDKFYRFIIVTHPTPALITVWGPWGKPAKSQCQRKEFTSIPKALNAGLAKSREKEGRRGYHTLTRSLTGFGTSEAVAADAGPSNRESVWTLCEQFAQAAAAQGTAHPDASPV